MEKVKLSIIIVDYKSKKYLFECLKSIKENIKDIKYEIIIVDNNQDPEYKVKDHELKWILPTPYSLLSTTNNNGFGCGNNAGAKIATGEFLFLLNPDTLVIDDSIQKMVDFTKSHKEIGALTCLLYQKDGASLQENFFGKFQSLAGLTVRRYNYQKIDLSKEFFYTDIVTGAAFMIRKKLFDQVGGFDPNIFMYLEDDDLCKRLVDAGYKNAVLNTAKIIHFEGKSSTNSEKKRYYYKSQDYYWKKHNGIIPTLLMRLIRWPYKYNQTK